MKKKSSKKNKKDLVKVNLEPSKPRIKTTQPVAPGASRYPDEHRVNRKLTKLRNGQEIEITPSSLTKPSTRYVVETADVHITQKHRTEPDSAQPEKRGLYNSHSEHMSREKPQKPAFVERRPDQFSFYHQHIQERQSRSRSRGRHQSTDRASRPSSITSRDASRGRSRSRDIISLYTTPRARSATPSGGLRSYIYTPTPSDRQHRPNSSSSMPYMRSRSESRLQSANRDTLSLCSTMTTQSRALSNSDIAAENLKLWISKTQRRRSTSRQRAKNDLDKLNNLVPMLETDQKTNDEIENALNHANSLKPARYKMMMIAGHTPSSDWASEDEIAVKPGVFITGLYKQNEWLFIELEDGKSGFVPFAYTKPIRMDSLNKLAKSTMKTRPAQIISQPRNDSSSSGASVTGILKTRHRNTNGNHQNRTAAVRDSVSSTPSVFNEDLDYSHRILPAAAYADCMVVDTDHKYDSNGFEELATHCSDSGISEPTSNHSDELEQILSGKYSKSLSLRNNATNSYTSNSSLSHTTPTNGRVSQRSTTLLNEPFGLLGQRLQRQSSSTVSTPRDSHIYSQIPAHKMLSEEMLARAQTNYGSYTDPALKPDIPKDYNGPRVRVVYDYRAENDDDVTVMAGDIVTVLNGEDVEWIWVLCRNGREGFLPRDFTVPLQVTNSRLRSGHQPLIVAL